MKWPVKLSKAANKEADRLPKTVRQRLAVCFKKSWITARFGETGKTIVRLDGTGITAISGKESRHTLLFGKSEIKRSDWWR
jgi:hypothetical protein